VEAYYADKPAAVSQREADHFWVLNADEAGGARARRWSAGPARAVLAATRRGRWYDGAARRLQLGRETLLARAELGLLGDHNVANALAAALAVREAGVTPDVIGTGLRSFRALAQPARAGARGGRRPLGQRLEGHEPRLDRGRGGSGWTGVRAAAGRPAQRRAVHAVGAPAQGQVPAGDRVR